MAMAQKVLGDRQEEATHASTVYRIWMTSGSKLTTISILQLATNKSVLMRKTTITVFCCHQLYKRACLGNFTASEMTMMASAFGYLQRQSFNDLSSWPT
jgi:hypothetical protein